MTRRPRYRPRGPGLAAALAFAVGMAVVVPARAQMREHEADPEELGIRDLTSLTIPTSEYVGAETCAECHPKAFHVWVGTEHARSFVPMLSRAALEIAKELKITAEAPTKSGICLGCHATAVDVPAAYREPGFHMGDGVSCERCHGPGGDHIRAVQGDAPPSNLAIELPKGEEFCLGCHLDKPAHEKVARIPKFVFEERWPRIAHPEERNE